MIYTLDRFARTDGYGEALVPLALVKQHARILHDDEDDLIGVLRDAAIEVVEELCSLRFTATPGLVFTFKTFGGDMRIWTGPVSTLVVTAISYIDANGDPQSVADGGWRLDGRTLMPAIGTSWPKGATRVSVTVTAGFASDALPQRLKLAAMMMTTDFYNQRESVVFEGVVIEVPGGIRQLCRDYVEGRS